MSRLHDLYDQQGQSPWLDNIRRGWITSGELAGWVDRGVRGLTSNPSIFEKAIGGSDDYDEQFGALVRAGTGIEDSYWELVTSDIEAALAILRPVYDESDGLDGYVSVEVDPGLARDTDEGAALAATTPRTTPTTRGEAPPPIVSAPRVARTARAPMTTRPGTRSFTRG